MLIDEDNKIATLVCAKPLTEGEEVIGVFAKAFRGTCLHFRRNKASKIADGIRPGAKMGVSGEIEQHLRQLQQRHEQLKLIAPY